MMTTAIATDPTGACFVSYRRSRLGDIGQVVEALLDCGIPPWQDRRELTSQPLGSALVQALASAETASALMWISEDIAESAAILNIEAPQILERTRNDPTFFADLWLADGLGYDKASELLKPAGLVEDLSAAWHLERVNSGSPRDGDHGKTRIDAVEARRIAAHALKRRLAKNHALLKPEEPVRVLFNAHAQADEGFRPGYPIQINWSRHFSHRFASQETWNDRLIPALDVVVRSVRKSAPGRRLTVEGRATIASSLVLGHAFREVTDIPIAWHQKPCGSIWSLGECEADCDVRAEPLRHLRIDAKDLAVFVCVTGNVEAAVNATTDLPKFRAVVCIRPTGGSARCDLRSPGEATWVARTIAKAIRDARHELRTIERTHLFFAGPAGLAMLVGQQINAVGPVQTYEHMQTGSDGVGQYVPAALLADPTTKS